MWRIGGTTRSSITPEYKIPSRMTTGRRQLLMSLIWLYTRKGQVIDLDRVPYSTLDLVEAGTKDCMTKAQVEEEERTGKTNEMIDEVAEAQGRISGFESALAEPLHVSKRKKRRQAPKHCESGHWSGRIRDFTRADKDLFDELWGTRVGELHRYLHSNEKKLSDKEDAYKDMQQYDDSDPKDMERLEKESMC